MNAWAKNKTLYPDDQVFWYLKKSRPKQLHENITTDVVIVGGGMAGLSAAQAFHAKGYSVVLLEKYYCGAGASGKSSGFITPSSEFDLSYVYRLFGADHAKQLWGFVMGGVELIRNNITQYNIVCDLQQQDTLVVANSKGDFADLQKEYDMQQQLFGQGFLYQKDELTSVIGSPTYFGGLRIANTFGISTYLYCQAMKEMLMKAGVQVFEETPVVTIDAQGAHTPYATVQADHIVVCVDRFLPDLHRLVHDVFHAQTFIMVSAPLPDDAIKKMFPAHPLMVWDTDMIYQYYRIIEGNRLIVGGGSLLSTFWGKEQHNAIGMYKKLRQYVAKRFPDISPHFEYLWPGLIGISKDIMPIADFDTKDPRIYYITGATGLPWAAALGRHSAERIIDGNKVFDTYFSSQRKFPLPQFFQALFGKRITFSLSNFISLYMPFLKRK